MGWKNFKEEMKAIFEVARQKGENARRKKGEEENVQIDENEFKK